MNSEKIDNICKICGRAHAPYVSDIFVGSGAVSCLQSALKKLGSKKVYVIADKNTYAVAGKIVTDILDCEEITYSTYIFNDEHLEPDEAAVGRAFMNYNMADTVIGIGSGVINDTGKLLATMTRSKYIIVGTAPSMDGYASANSSMVRNGLKVSLSVKSPDVIIGDTDILKTAPDRMLRAGIGDVIAKYISICEWRIASLIIGEEFDERIAESVRAALKSNSDNKEGLLRRENSAIEAVFDGLVTCGVAMSCAGCSRPASGVEHYFSHVWDMRGLAFSKETELHGTQCAYGTLLAVRMYERLKKITPDREKAINYVKNFDKNAWFSELRGFIGDGADAMIAAEERDGKYDVESHEKRIDVIIENWEEILSIIDEELPTEAKLLEYFDVVGLPTSAADIGIDGDILDLSFKATKDIRDKYVLSRLLWDLGVIDDEMFKL